LYIIILYVIYIILYAICTLLYIVYSDIKYNCRLYNIYKEPPVSDGYILYNDSFKDDDIDFINLKKRNTEILLDKGINIEKVRFVQVPVNTYNITKNLINVPIKKMIPIMSDGRFDRSREPINLENEYINDLKSVISLSVHKTKLDDIKDAINNSKYGFVFQLINEETIHYELDTELIRFINLDEERLKYEHFQENI